ncbi:MAG: ribosome-associated translation inhibitor RaiA [Oscillospiraceae bacterium]|jgi:putative sigma-54 modulation protein|nr:ribosome-associated translation inhibitor RaiA [Oscillospiraceae bacterium]
MRFTFTEKKITTSPDLRAYAERKIGKLDRFFRDESDAFVTFSLERGRHIAEVTLRNGGMFYRVSEQTGDMYASIDSAVASIERQIRKNKTRLEKRLRAGSLTEKLADAPALVAEPVEEEEDYKIIRTKRIAIKPMSVEEAVLQMNLLGHDFFVFRDQDNDEKYAVVYRRKSGGYGLIEDEK